MIRLAVPEDGPTLAAIYAPAVALATSFELVSPDGAEMARRVAALTERLPWLVCEQAGEVLGYAYAGPHRERPAYRWSVEVSAYVRSERQRAGIGRGLYASLFAVLALQGFRNAYAGITLPNAASVGLHTTVGFTPVGVYTKVGYKAGAWHDVAWFERPLAAHVVDPPPPRPLAEVRGEPGFAAALAAGQPFLRPGRPALAPSASPPEPDRPGEKAEPAGPGSAPDELRIRPATAADTAWVLELVPRLSEAGLPPWRSVAPMNAAKSVVLRAAIEDADDGTQVLVAERVRDGLALGFVHLVRAADSDRGEPHGHVVHLVVRREGEGQGVGQALMRAAEGWARERGFRQLTLGVFEHNRRARELYERLGYDIDTLKMVKPLGG